MPAYLVEIPSNKRVADADTLVVFAADVAGARAAAAGHFDGDAAALWNTVATVTEIVAGVNLGDAGDGWSMYIRISGAAGQTAGFDPYIVEVDGLSKDLYSNNASKVRLHVGSVALNDGGVATYVVDDILTAAGGTVAPGGRAATFRVITVNTGVITAVELVDPGEYTVMPPLTANAVTGGGGSGALMDLTQAAGGSYEAIMAQALTEVLASPDIQDATLDLSEGASGARLFTVAGTTNDDLGDGTLEIEMRQHGVAFAPLLSTVTHEGLADAVLSVAIPASPLAPARVVALKT